MAAFMRFLPTVAVYAVMHAVAGLPVGPQLLWSIPIIVLVLVFGTGATMFVAALQVYFRDLTNILPYFLRIWLYVSPVLYYTDEVPDRFKAILVANPLYPLLGSMSDAVNQGQTPSAALLAGGCAWAFGALVVGALFFISREREFAVRL
jgi:teichoic acid transport system permease protein